MSTLQDKSHKISEILSSLIYRIGQGQSHEQLHRQAVALLLEVNELEQLVEQSEQKQQKRVVTAAELELQEIRKVRRKLQRWAKNPGQVNSRLLSHFLALQQRGDSPISKEQMEQFAEREGIKNFNSNFFGMSHIGAKNHGKVFDVVEGIVSVWPSVADAVARYEAETVSKSDVGEQEVEEVTVEGGEEKAAQSMEPIYRTFKALWLKRGDRTQLLSEIVQQGVSMEQATTHIDAMEAMMYGKPYEHPMSENSIRYFLSQIQKDFSSGYFGRVVGAIQQHLEQQEQLGNPQPEIRTLLSRL